ncbi:uncharacterized protein LOC126816091 [Patella vulgata]|uniref:uncharacterized protein LOC126816091 n=1 Tax=Patella vulgata TaxID=6465 RepID=UPI0024A90AD8|nr:uncharacterized protein LOC126816091 [Patella vulgata]
MTKRIAYKWRIMFYMSIVYVSINSFLFLQYSIHHIRSEYLQQSDKYDAYKLNHVLSQDSNCFSHYGKNAEEDIQRVLKIKISNETELILQNLGYPPTKIVNRKYELPILKDNGETPEIPVFVTAVSSNHYRELQALIYNIDRVPRQHYPHLKLIVYNIGLEPEELVMTKIRCNCEVRKFNFKKYPRHVRIMATRAWKPIIIQEILNEFGFAMYMDASIRFRRPNLDDVFMLTREIGHMFLESVPLRKNLLPNHTHAKTFEYFDVNPCLFHERHEIQSGFVLMTRNNVYSNVIMKAWLSCCLQEQCVLPTGANWGVCNRSSLVYHKCHRPDQSPLGITVHLLYHPPDTIPYIPPDVYVIRRDEVFNYF